ncbi:hypothetical protein BH10PSE4_BH10PSE4_14260 [soil metagenome]
MSPRLVLSLIWIAGLVVSLTLVELYFHLTVGGVPYLFPDQRAQFLQPVAALYGTVIAGILASWFIKRFNPPASDPEARALFWLALLCTLIWILGAVYLIGQRLIWPHQDGTLEDDFKTVQRFGVLFAFLVAPVNFYYFGIKPKPV